MLLLFGPAGVGKSSQGRLLADTFDWVWLSAGHLLRESSDPAIKAIIEKGEFVPDSVTHKIMGDAIKANKNAPQILLDGFPRQIQEVDWLADWEQTINAIIVFHTTKEEIQKRLIARGRKDDTLEVIETRLAYYETKTRPVINHYISAGTPMINIDSTAPVEETQLVVVSELRRLEIIN